MAYGNDYTYDFKTHRIIQKGHVIIDSLPGGIVVTADGRVLGKRTPYQAAYSIGDHIFRLEKDGFWPWEKKLMVTAGRVALADYVIMVPKKPVVTELDAKTQITAQTISKDHRHLAYVVGGTDAAVYTLDLGNKKLVKLYSAKPAVAASEGVAPVGAEVLHDVAWSDDASHLLIVSEVGGVLTHRLAAAGGGEPVNLTQTYGFNFNGLHFSGSNWRQMYWVSPDGLRRLDMDAAAVSGVLADKVSQFWVQPDRVLYVQQTDLGRSLWSLDSRGKRQQVISALVESDSYSVALSRYNNEDELAVVPAKTGVATLYSGIFSDTPVAKVVAQGIVSVSFSPKNGRFLALNSAAGSSVYDLERSTLEHSFVLYPAPAARGTLSAVTWFDDEHLLSNRDGELYWSDFDGTNQVDLGRGYGVLPAYGDADTRGVIVFRPTDTGVRVLQLQIR
ncbi:MAG TPA: PEGA domain-containing protein [Candidatus Saccharimonadia bacterium]|nr:PEGA domain-containing protein [Candidatus Saccharimonadia bacterium]